MSNNSRKPFCIPATTVFKPLVDKMLVICSSNPEDPEAEKKRYIDARIALAKMWQHFAHNTEEGVR